MKQKINKLNNNEREIKKYRSITINYPFFFKKKKQTIAIMLEFEGRSFHMLCISYFRELRKIS